MEKTNENNVLKVTSVKVFPFKESINMGHFKAIANVVLNDQLLLRGLRVMDGEDGMFVGYPFDPLRKGDEYRNIFFPITAELRQHIEKSVLEKYDEATKEAK